MLARPQLTPDIAQRYLDEIDTELARRAAKRMEAGRFLDFCRDPDLFQEYPVFYHQEKAIQGTRNWNALFQGHPTTEERAIIKTSMWRKWPGRQPPIVDYIVQSIDGAFEEDEDADYSARTTWGVFDIFRADNARVLQAIWKDKNR